MAEAMEFGQALDALTRMQNELQSRFQSFHLLAQVLDKARGAEGAVLAANRELVRVQEAIKSALEQRDQTLARIAKETEQAQVRLEDIKRQGEATQREWATKIDAARQTANQVAVESQERIRTAEQQANEQIGRVRAEAKAVSDTLTKELAELRAAVETERKTLASARAALLELRESIRT